MSSNGLAERCAETMPQTQTCQREYPGRQADDEGGVADRYSQHAQAQAHRQGIDADGDGQQDERPAAGRIQSPDLFGPATGMIDHSDSDRSSAVRSYPVIELPDERLNGRTRKPAEDRHDELEQPEMERQPEDWPRTADFRKRARGKRNREGIHRHAQGKQYNSGDVTSIENESRARPTDT